MDLMTKLLSKLIDTNVVMEDLINTMRVYLARKAKLRKEETVYLTTQSIYFIYDYMDIL